MNQTQIGIIREAIQFLGGNHIESHMYYADGPSTRPPKRDGTKEVIYKIPKYEDGLTPDSRKHVVENLKNHPQVKDAYLSRRYRTMYSSNEGHLKVVFAK